MYLCTYEEGMYLCMQVFVCGGLSSGSCGRSFVRSRVCWVYAFGVHLLVHVYASTNLDFDLDWMVHVVLSVGVGRA